MTVQESALCNRIVNDWVVEVNIKYGGKYLDLKEIKGRRGCYIYKWTNRTKTGKLQQWKWAGNVKNTRKKTKQYRSKKLKKKILEIKLMSS